MPRSAPPDLTGRLEIVLDPDARPGSIVPVLARLLRQMRDRERAARQAEATREQRAG
jgi:hypothetical protein